MVDNLMLGRGGGVRSTEYLLVKHAEMVTFSIYLSTSLCLSVCLSLSLSLSSCCYTHYTV